MALAVTHAFVTGKADGTDVSLLRPSNWNAGHVITMDTNTLMGKASAGTGPAEPIPVSAATIALLASADIPTILAYLGISPPMTGDAKFTFRATADPTWVLMNDGTISDGLSTVGATCRGNVDTQALFTLLYNNVVDAWAPVFTSTGTATTRAALGSAATAFAAHSLMLLPKQLGRAIVGAGTGSGLTARALGSSFGADTGVITAANLPAHTHSGATGIENQTHTHTGTATASADLSHGGFAPGSGPIPGATTVGGATSTESANHTHNFTTDNGPGTSTPVSLAQASAAWNVMLKL
jgi:hypothetical protein